MHYTQKQVATRFNVTPRTIANWARAVKDYLSQQQGGNRQYTESDIAVLATYRYYKQQKLSNDDILDRLGQGVRIEPPPSRTLETLLDASDTRIEAESLRKERDALLARIEALEQKLDDAMDRERALLREIGDLQERAARAETKLKWWWQ